MARSCCNVRTIDHIAQKRGPEWPEGSAERQQVAEWLTQPKQYRRLVAVAHTAIPTYETDDVLQWFWAASLARCLDTFEPSGGDAQHQVLVAWVCGTLARDCAAIREDPRYSKAM